MAKVKVLIEGHMARNENGRYSIGSTVTLVLTREHRILVDTGSFPDEVPLIRGLAGHALTPDDIDVVILTHLDLDHIVNTHLFRRAKVFCKFRGGEYPGQVHFPADGTLERSQMLGMGLIDEDIEIIPTPGHAEDMISVAVRSPAGRVVVAGDAFPDKSWTNFDRQPDPLIVDVAGFNESRKRILRIADYIVPGHGGMFPVTSRDTAGIE
ncbi:MAG: hypothetical protein DRH37_06835 [Deltaproteobacteria bacterium]|nr:MAG: hypothetical protein DRH37_06835 [Deltaproteobacteria bacterium]